ncbi:MAG: orotate phosphoribosyltransferase [Caloramator sp.]|nr:orotate phosphoribosyltransferase [Caloramator sp.]
MDVMKTLIETEALLEGHFLLTSGRHSDKFIMCSKLMMFPDKAEAVLKNVVQKLKDVDFDVVIGPAMGGVLVSYEIARQLGKAAMFTEKEGEGFVLRRGFEIKKGQKVLIAEDVVTTGKSSKGTIEVVKALGGEVVGIACIVDRSTKEFEYPIYSAIRLDIETYEESDCPLCKKGIPLVKPKDRR